MVTPQIHEATWERMIRAVEKVRERCDRAAKALEGAGIPYAVIGANAVAFWVAAKDEGAIRNTPNVDVIVDQEAWPATRRSLETVGFALAEATERPVCFLDGPDGKLRQAVQVWFSGDVVSPTSEPLPSLVHALPTEPHRVIALPALVRMKLSAWRTIDRVHLQDLIGVGQIDATWPDKFPEVLADRLRQILANPDG
jgi:hypothetical protein